MTNNETRSTTERATVDDPGRAITRRIASLMRRVLDRRLPCDVCRARVATCSIGARRGSERGRDAMWTYEW